MGDGSFNIGERNFKLNKIDAFKQFHIVRRIGPLMADALPILQEVMRVKVDQMTESQKLEHFAKILSPIMMSLSKLSDSDSDYVLYRLLESVEIHQKEFHTWARIAKDSQLMMQDLDLSILIQVAGRALAFNLSSFFSIAQRQA